MVGTKLKKPVLVGFTDTKRAALIKKRLFMKRGVSIKIKPELGGFSVLRTTRKRKK